MIFKRSGGLRHSEPRRSESAASAVRTRGRAAQALRQADTGGALALLDGLVEYWQKDALTARSLASAELAEVETLRAIALDRAERYDEVPSACDRALRLFGAWEAKALDARSQISLLLGLRIQALEAVDADDERRAEVFEESVDILAALPGAARRTAVWLIWTRKLITLRFDRGETDEAFRLVRQLVDRLPGIGGLPRAGFKAVQEALAFVHELAPRAAQAGDPRLATELVDRCVALFENVGADDLSEQQGLDVARIAVAGGLKFDRLGLADPSTTLYAFAVDRFRALGDVSGRDAKLRAVFATSLNGYAWQLAKRGDSEAGLPVAQEAVEYARGAVQDAAVASSSSMPDMRFTLAAALDTLATLHAQRGAMDVARDLAVEAHELAAEQGAHAATLKLITMIDEGATSGFADREA
ncbi:hypothetical protein KDK95_23660 [Actinospica sp. MGRD01-02]|uniref:Tetratricopeptide repeat protein n=1 Tax=Actinospica acidithermotolerans TaxID=2828514 RepID=A0A941EAP0_9ACTN|nr:hypothetical protein [Actinospica acidithermotolerans]MBR7829325.1 hypothetical protein [Actinospica acidithermotolerans]